jgi:arginine decarboxylase
MNNKYIDLVDQSFDFPQPEFKLEDKNLQFHDIDLMKLVEDYGAPLKFTYLPQISNNIQRAKKWFADAFEKHDYKGKYNYCYCTKSSHFKHVLDEALTNNINIETSSAFDIDIVKALKKEGKITNKTYVLSNGFKREQYITNIADLINGGHKNAIPIIDTMKKLIYYLRKLKGSLK